LKKITVNGNLDVDKNEKQYTFVPLLFIGPRYEIERWQFWFIMGTYALLLLNVLMSDINYLFCIWFISKQRTEYFPLTLWAVESVKNLCLVLLLGLGDRESTPIFRKMMIVGVIGSGLITYFFIKAFVGAYAWLTCFFASIVIGFFTRFFIKKMMQDHSPG
jgi:hypothetical protein